MIYCVRNHTEDPLYTQYQRVRGGFATLPQFRPIYFEDPIYRQTRQHFLLNMVNHDEQQIENPRLYAKNLQRLQQLHEEAATAHHHHPTTVAEDPAAAEKRWTENRQEQHSLLQQMSAQLW